MSRFTSRPPPPISGIVDLSVSSRIVTMALQAAFDYIIIGGGTAGLVVANRLSKDPTVNVLVLEAGSWQFENQTILNPGFTGGATGTVLDWNYETVPQTGLNGRKVVATRGKLLGGCSTVNGFMWCRPHGSDFDAWEKLGNKGWGWKAVLPFFKASETFHSPSVTQTSVVGIDDQEEVLPIPIVNSVHGNNGPVQTSYSPYISPQFDEIYQAFIDAGIKETADINGGDPTGVSWVSASLHPETQTRESSDVAYLNPFRHRTNLLVVTNAHVTNIDWTSRLRGGNVVADGVSFKSTLGGNTGPVFSSKVNKEVILSGGAFNTPQVLELSGVGDARRLKTLGIGSVIDLPAVGQNLQDHPIVLLTFKLNSGHVSLDTFRSDPAFAALALEEYREGKGILCQSYPLAALLKPSQFLKDDEEIELGRSFIKEGHTQVAPNSSIISDAQRAAQLALYDDSPMIELMFMNDNLAVKPEPGASYVSCVLILEHALSRGTVHIKSKDPFTAPDIDPEYLSHPADEWFIAKGVQYVRKLFRRSHLADICVEVGPGYDVLPRTAGKDEWLKWIRSRVSTAYHPMGTAAALPKNDGGVVGSDLKLWGAENVRIADMSIAPLHLSCHLQTVAYMIGEKASAEITGVIPPQ